MILPSFITQPDRITASREDERRGMPWRARCTPLGLAVRKILEDSPHAR